LLYETKKGFEIMELRLKKDLINW